MTFALTGSKADAAASERRRSRPQCRRASFEPGRAPARRWAVKLDFVGASAVTPRRGERTPAVVSYFKRGRTRASTGLKTYRSVAYQELWPGIDLIYTGPADTQVHVRRQARRRSRPDPPRLSRRNSATLTETGQLEISTPVSFHRGRPYASGLSGAPRRGPMAFAMTPAATGRWLRLQGRGYDRSRPLVLDPSVLVYAGYIGGSGTTSRRASPWTPPATPTSSARPTPRYPLPGKVGPDLTFNGGSTTPSWPRSRPTAATWSTSATSAARAIRHGIAVDEAGNAYVRAHEFDRALPGAGGAD